MQIKSRNWSNHGLIATLERALSAMPRNFPAAQRIAKAQMLALLSAKTGQALVITLLLFMQASPADAWRVYNETSHTIRARINSGLGNTSCGAWNFSSGFEIGPGGDAGPNWTDGDCNPSGLQDQQFTMQIFVCDRNFCPGDITFDPTDYVPAEGEMQAILTMRAGSSLTVHEQDRFYMGLPSNFYALTAYQGELEDSSDYYAQTFPIAVPPMQPDNRDVRFLVTGDPQYSYRNLEEGTDDYESGTMDANRVLTHMAGMIRDTPQIRGMAITGDLTQTARIADGIGCTADEMAPSLASTGFPNFVYEGLGNHDIEDILFCSAPDELSNYVGTKTRNTRKTAKSGPHYSWDWHDVHFIQANLFPGDVPSLHYPGLDPSWALSFLKTDLAQNVGDSGRPVVLFHHYGFDPFSAATIGEIWWTAAERKAYWDALLDYNVVAIFTGHNHGGTSSSVWSYDFSKPPGAAARADGQPIKTFNAAAAKGATQNLKNDGVFLDVRMTANNEMVIERKNENGQVVGGAGGTITVSFTSTTFNPISMDVGVIPDAAGDCPVGATLDIFQDNEDDSPDNGPVGWNGAIESSANTLWRFCRVDGTLFGKLPLPVSPLNSIDNDYAVLKLGAECPLGATEVVRFFDDEDDANSNSISGFAGPNVSNIAGTELHLCHFRPQNEQGWYMPAFPDLGFEYGVFGQSSISTDSGSLYTDDENDNNSNSITSQFAFTHIIDAAADTRAYFIKTAVFSAPANDAFDAAVAISPGTFAGTLLGASNDGSNSIGQAFQPDVWYKYSAVTGAFCG